MIALYTLPGLLLSHLLISKVNSLPTIIKGVNGIVTMEVPLGEDVVVTCKSNDETHNFNYWNVIDKNIIIGPQNEFDKSKFRFSILSGNLTVKGMSENDEGTYSCVSAGVRKDDIKIQNTKLEILKEWEEVYETDPTVNAFRVIIILATLAILAGGGFLIYKMWRDRYRYPRYLQEEDEDDDDESAEELFRTPGTSGTSTSSKSVEKMERNDHRFENPSISTDFTSILDAVNKK